MGTRTATCGTSRGWDLAWAMPKLRAGGARTARQRAQSCRQRDGGAKDVRNFARVLPASQRPRSPSETRRQVSRARDDVSYMDETHVPAPNTQERRREPRVVVAGIAVLSGGAQSPLIWRLTNLSSGG